MEEERVAIIGIFIRDTKAAGRVNDLLHEYSDCIIGRMGIPCREKSINIISIVVSASQGRISALSGQLGRIEGITSKAMQAQVKTDS
jgi:putative iron-only hydrogenase system regulator